MLPPDGTGTGWDRSWLAALTVLKTARQVFRPGNRPPGELMPLVEPTIRLQGALRAKDPVGARTAALELTGEPELIAWATRSAQPPEIRQFGASLAWLAQALRDGPPYPPQVPTPRT